MSGLRLLAFSSGHADVDGVHLVLLKRTFLHLNQEKGERSEAKICERVKCR